MQCFKCNRFIEETPTEGLHLNCFLTCFGLEKIMPFEHLYQHNSDSFSQETTHYG